MHENMFQYLKPTDEQMGAMEMVRGASAIYYETLEHFVPDGPDKTYLLRKLRETAMWANIAITRNPDGSPRSG
jgi:hypothetical protein